MTTQSDESAGQKINREYAEAIKNGIYQDLGKIIDWHIKAAIAHRDAELVAALEKRKLCTSEPFRVAMDMAIELIRRGKP